jgi:hypothetical protein
MRRHFSRRTPVKQAPKAVPKFTRRGPNPALKPELDKFRKLHPNAVKLLHDLSPVSSPLFDIKAEDLKRANFSKKLEAFRKQHPDSNFIVIVRTEKSPPSPLYVPDNKVLPYLKNKLRKLQTIRNKDKKLHNRVLNIDTIYEHIPYDRPLPPKGIQI